MHTKEKTSSVVVRMIIAVIVAAYVLFPFILLLINSGNLLVINSGKETSNITANPVSLAGSSLGQFRFNIHEVINDPNLFCKLLMILSATYEGSIAIVMVQRDPYRDAIMESIIKFTQQRYGIISWIVEDPEDLFCIHETPFTPNGLITLIEDLKKFDELNGYANSISIE